MVIEPNFVAMVRGMSPRWGAGRTVRYLTRRSVLYTVAIGGALLYALPLFLMISTSFKSGDILYIRPFQWIPATLHFENYVQAWTAFPFTRYLWNTLFITAMSMIGAVITTSMAGYAFARLSFPARGLFFGFLIASLLLPREATFIPTFIIWWKLGFVNTYVPLIAPDWMASGVARVFLLRQFFRTLPMELEAAGKIDGATPFQRYSRIILPLSKPAIGVVLIFEFIGSWNSFVEPLIYLKDEEMFTLNVGLNMFRDAYSQQFSSMPQMHWFMAIATLIVIPVVVIFVLLQRHFVEGIQLTGIKG